MQDTAPDMSGECVISSVLSRRSKDLKQRTSYNSYNLVTAQFYSATKGKYTLEAGGWASLRGDPTANVDSVMVWSQILFTSFYMR